MGDHAAAAALRRARVRAAIKTDVIHFVPSDYHECLDESGKFTFPGKNPRYSGGPFSYRIMSPCGVTLFPRGEPTQRKICHFTRSVTEVTCKTCLRSLNAVLPRKTNRRHYAPGSFGGRTSSPVCGKSDPVRYRETFSPSMIGVNCPVCMRTMQKGRRRARTPRQS